MVAVGNSPGRLKEESTFAALCDLKPMGALTGKTWGRSLNRGGVSDANNRPWTLTVIRTHGDAGAKKYVNKRVTESKLKKEI